jgi:hypothetical protein
LQVSLHSLDPEAWAVLLEGVALRHLLIHANGIVDSKHLAAVPTSKFQLGQHVHVGRSEAESMVRAAETLSRALLIAISQ